MKLLAIGYVLSWIATSGQAAPGGGPWYAPLTCGSDKTSLLGTSSNSAMMGTFEFAPAFLSSSAYTFAIGSNLSRTAKSHRINCAMKLGIFLVKLLLAPRASKRLALLLRKAWGELKGSHHCAGARSAEQ